MINRTQLIVSHPPYWHNGSRVSERSYHIMGALLPAVLLGVSQYGAAALGVVCLSVSSAIGWEWAMNRLMKRPVTVGDGNAALIGLLFAMLLPATTPWWAVLTGTFVAVVIGQQIFGGIGANPYNPVCVSYAILMVSWKDLFDFDLALLNYDLGFTMAYPLGAAKAFGAEAVASFSPGALLLGQQVGGIGTGFGLGLIAGGLYLILRGFIRWEIAISYLGGVFLTAYMFNISNPQLYAGPAFHLLTGYTLIAAFFLMTEDASSPVNFIAMLLYGAMGGLMTVLIRNIGAYPEGVILAILVVNTVNPLLDKIRPKALGKVT
jgi:electron transport complex protein RnfD